MILSPILLPALAALAAGPSPATILRSKEWVVRRGDIREEEFSGDVRYDSAGTHLAADWALYRHASKDWLARGRVGLRKELQGGDVFEAYGETARYDESSLAGALEPAAGERVRFSRTPPGLEPDRGEGGRLEWLGDREATLVGRARVWGPRLAVWADTARYERAGGRLVLRGGRPVLEKIEGEWTTALKADEIEATEAPRRIEARGKVKGWLIFKRKDKLKELAK